jgi:hypothetical protein
MRIRVLLIVLSLFGTTSLAVAQGDTKKTDTDEKASESKAKQSDKSKVDVYTKEHLKEQVDESAKSPSVIYNENLERKSAERGDTSAVVFTNETLTSRYGDPAPAAVETTEPSPGSAPAGEAAADPNAEPDAEPDAEPAMSDEERTKRMAEIEAQIARLEKRTLAIKNPFAARSPPTDEERTNEQGMTNPQRLQSVESEIAKLKAELQELQSGN